LLDATQPLDLLDRVGEGVFALDPDWRFAYLNRQAERVLSRLSGTPSTDLLGTVIWDRPALADSSLGRALHRAHVEQTAVVHEVPDTGTRGSVEVRAYPSEDGLTVLLRENPLAGTTAQILDGMDEALIGCDHEWRITYMNEQAAKLLGISRHRRLPAFAREPFHVWFRNRGSGVRGWGVRRIACQAAVERPLPRSLPWYFA